MLNELVFILDKSGSMNGLEKDTIGGFNSLIEKQRKEEGECLVTTVLFNDSVNFVTKRVNLKDIKLLTEKEYVPAGCTSLLDAIGESISYINNEHAKLDKESLPNKTLFIITTDGLENSSKEYTYSQIKNMIKNAEENKCEFLFLGANMDAVEEASKFGIKSKNAVTYEYSAQGVSRNFKCLDKAVYAMRTTGCIDESWREEIDKEFKKLKKQLKR